MSSYQGAQRLLKAMPKESPKTKKKCFSKNPLGLELGSDVGLVLYMGLAVRILLLRPVIKLIYHTHHLKEKGCVNETSLIPFFRGTKISLIDLPEPGETRMPQKPTRPTTKLSLVK
jgi:hypothetical protein